MPRDDAIGSGQNNSGSGGGAGQGSGDSHDDLWDVYDPGGPIDNWWDELPPGSNPVGGAGPGTGDSNDNVGGGGTGTGEDPPGGANDDDEDATGGDGGDSGGGGGGDDDTDVYNPSGGPSAPIAEQMWANEGWAGDKIDDLYSGEYAANKPVFDPYSQIGTLAEAGAGIEMYDVPDQLDYYDKFMNANPAWEQSAQLGESKMLERLGQYGGSATGGFSGQQSAGLGSYWSDQVADRWGQAAPYVQDQWSADTGKNITDWQRQWQTTETDYGNEWNVERQNYGEELSGYNAPYNFAEGMVPNFWSQSPVSQQAPSTGGGSDIGGLVGGIAGGVGGWYMGGPAGAAAGWQMGSNLGYEYL